TDAMAEPFKRMVEVDQTIVPEKGVRKLLRAIRRARPDIFLVPFPSNRWQYAMLALASGARRKILHSYPFGHWRAMHFLGERIHAERGLHDVEQNVRLLKSLEIEPGAINAPCFDVTDDDRARAARILAEFEITSSGSFIAIHAGSASTDLARAK